MKVIFLKDVPETADAGEVKEVKNGFARNYLLPKGLAAPPTADALQPVVGSQEAPSATRRTFAADGRVLPHPATRHTLPARGHRDAPRPASPAALTGLGREADDRERRDRGPAFDRVQRGAARLARWRRLLRSSGHSHQYR